ncbi:MAG: CDGSH iron-sulfur domain-containing protein [Thermoanaerobaculaceae bacterium]|nr:CDGSH iron-sulfur domain-containing protein [Thermoanaerobaculaceae bacterium]MDI9622702.1 CDGSH iron-sulfur domain-containing protein [Acidobacteriota bacterium]NLH09751.1 CDGSH iron-sulfur domain-containing protein [Holophagae bacterium]
MSEEPVIAQRGPYTLEMEPGTYWWCACGRSRTQPFCDGSHVGTPFVPKEVRIEARGKVAWCGCKRSRRGERCDGTHRMLGPEESAR